MPKKTWNVEIDGKSHIVEMEHGSLFGGKVIKLDGNPFDKNLLQRKNGLQLTGSEDRFQVDGHEVAVYAYSNGFKFKYDLAVDGNSVQTGKPVIPPLPVPGWAWPLIILNGAIIFLGGAFPALIGIAGTANCFRLARDPKKPLGKRVAWCVSVTVLSWVAIFLVNVGLELVFHRRE